MIRHNTLFLALLVGCGLSHAERSAPEGVSDEALRASKFVISVPLALDRASFAAGDTVTGTVTYKNTGSAAIAVPQIAITARPPGATHAGWQLGDDFNPYATPGSIAAGASVTVTAARTFASSDPAGQWVVFATWQD